MFEYLFIVILLTDIGLSCHCNNVRSGRQAKNFDIPFREHCKFLSAKSLKL